MNSHKHQANQAISQLLRLGPQLLAQAKANDWMAVRATDNRLNLLLAELKKDADVWTLSQTARRTVQQLHQEVCDLCKIELASSKKNWEDMQKNQEGLSAYDEVGA